MTFFSDGSKAYAFICYKNENNKRIEVVTSAALEKWRSLTLKIVWTINLEIKEKNFFIGRHNQNLYVRSIEKWKKVYLFLMIKGNLYMPLKRSRGEIHYSKRKLLQISKKKPISNPQKDEYH